MAIRVTGEDPKLAPSDAAVARIYVVALKTWLGRSFMTALTDVLVRGHATLRQRRFSGPYTLVGVVESETSSVSTATPSPYTNPTVELPRVQ